MAEGGQPDPGRVQVQPLHVLSPGPVEDGRDWNRFCSQQKVPKGHKGHVSGEFHFKSDSKYRIEIFMNISIEKIISFVQFN